MQINGFRPYRPLDRPAPGGGGIIQRSKIEASGYFHTREYKTVKSKRRETEEKDSGVLTHVNAVHVDIDCREVGLEVGFVTGAVETLVGRGAIPEPSARILSGRGVWYMWFLADQYGHSPRATPEVKEWARALNVRLCSALDLLGADRQSVNLNRWVRVPNSVNTKAGERVSYWVRQTATGPATVTLSELDRWTNRREFLTVPEQLADYLREHNRRSSRRLILRKAEPLPSTSTDSERGKRSKRKARADGQPINRKKQEAGVAGHKKVHHVRRSAIEFKARVWGGVPAGKRDAVVLQYAAALYRYGIREETALFRAVQRLDLQQPEGDPYTLSELTSTVRNAMKVDPERPITYEHLAELLELTEEESDAFFTETNDSFPAAGETKEQARNRHAQLTGSPRRRSLLQTLLSEFDATAAGRPPHRDIRRVLNERLQSIGEKTISRPTYFRDLEAIGERTPKDEGTPTSLDLQT